MTRPDELRELGIDTVVVAFTDMQGRLMGKRFHVDFFLEELEAGHEAEGCNYLVALDMQMDPQPGYSIAGWGGGFGDSGLRPHPASLRANPWPEPTPRTPC